MDNIILIWARAPYLITFLRRSVRSRYKNDYCCFGRECVYVVELCASDRLSARLPLCARRTFCYYTPITQINDTAH